MTDVAWGPAPGSAIRLTIPAKAEYITLGRLALTGLSRMRPLEDETLADLKLALTEACSNSIRHAYDDGRAGVVEIRYELDADKVAVEVADDGVGFSERTPGSTDGDLDEGGLGIAIIRAVVDELAIESNGGGSRLRFVKYLA